eukprot:10129294-Alexandrium_andersonii.AAC.1
MVEKGGRRCRVAHTDLANVNPRHQWEGQLIRMKQNESERGDAAAEQTNCRKRGTVDRNLATCLKQQCGLGACSMANCART